MGVVYKARHLAMDLVVALKLINPSYAANADFRARFAREAKTLAALEHPNIVKIFDAATWQGIPYLTMKFVAGKTLYHHLDVIRRDLPTACRLMVQVARAVHYLHAKGIVHRDLKPMNILLMEDYTPLLADFGLVRPVDSEFSISFVPLGTRQYMSPEQTRGGKDDYTPACDIWALGIILYELLAGHRPFSHDDTVELFRQIRQDPVPPVPSELNAPVGLETITRRCLVKSVAERYQTAEEVAVDLERWLAGEEIPSLPVAIPVPLTQPPAPPSIPKPRRRVRLILASLALVALLGFSGFPAPLQPDPAPAAPSVTELLERGDTVWIVGEKGLPLLPPERIAGWDYHLSTEQEGCCTLTTAQFGAALLCNQRLPRPVLLEAEVALSTTSPNGSWGGLIVCQKSVEATNGIHQTCLAITRQPVAVGKGWQVNRAIQLIWSHDGELLDRSEWESSAVPWNPPPRVKRPLEWERVSVLLAPASVTVHWQGDAIGTVTDPEPVALLNGRAPRAPKNGGVRFVSVVDGVGIGVIAHRTDVVIRNVRLIPVR